MKITDVETFVVGTDWPNLTIVRTDESREKRASTRTAGTGR